MHDREFLRRCFFQHSPVLRLKLYDFLFGQRSPDTPAGFILPFQLSLVKGTCRSNNSSFSTVKCCL